MNIRSLKITIIPTIIIILFFLIHQEYSSIYSGYTLRHIKIEIILVMSIYYSVFFMLKNNLHRCWVSLIPILLFYNFYEYCYISFGRVFRAVDILEVIELLDVLETHEIVALIFLTAFIILLVIINISKNIPKVNFIPIIVVFTIILSIQLFPNIYINIFEQKSTFGVTDWSDRETARNGYIASTMYFEAKRIKTKSNIINYYNREEFERDKFQTYRYWENKINNKNIHLIVLESFFNPKLLSRIDYSKETFHPDFLTLFNTRENIIISPVYGGGTAQAEFVLLCGVPALRKYSSIEFNVFTGKKAFCFPEMLKHVGYRVVASNAFKPYFFNTIPAYKGLGFSEVYFPKEFAPKRSSYISLTDNSQYMFDGDLLDQNLRFVKEHIERNNDTPLFNYVLGVYGHREYRLDEKRHPLIINANLNGVPVMDKYQRAVNQIYYRTKAISKYLNKLINLDHESIVIITADHLPDFHGKDFYREMGYFDGEEDNIYKSSFFLMVNGVPIKRDATHQYDIKNIIMDYITDYKYCIERTCKKSMATLEMQYKKTMAHAIM